MNAGIRLALVLHIVLEKKVVEKNSIFKD